MCIRDSPQDLPPRQALPSRHPGCPTLTRTSVMPEWDGLEAPALPARSGGWRGAPALSGLGMRKMVLGAPLSVWI
eukprot:8861808-Alexandrium_andersonii.AAC.1